MKKESKIKITIPRVKVGRSRAGLGLFAQKPFSRGDFVISYMGPIISDDKADEKGGKYLFAIGKDRVIDGTPRWNLARYINHSCKPNCYTEIDNNKVNIHAKRKIEVGEELTYNYGKEYFDEMIKPFGCRCEACKDTSDRK